MINKVFVFLPALFFGMPLFGMELNTMVNNDMHAHNPNMVQFKAIPDCYNVQDHDISIHSVNNNGNDLNTRESKSPKKKNEHLLQIMVSSASAPILDEICESTTFDFITKSKDRMHIIILLKGFQDLCNSIAQNKFTNCPLRLQADYCAQLPVEWQKTMHNQYLSHKKEYLEQVIFVIIPIYYCYKNKQLEEKLKLSTQSSNKSEEVIKNFQIALDNQKKIHNEQLNKQKDFLNKKNKILFEQKELRLKVDIKNLQTKMQALKNRLHVYEEWLEGKTKEYNALDKENKKLKSDVSNQSTQCTVLQEKNAKLNSTITQQKEFIELLEEEKNKLNDSMQKIEVTKNNEIVIHQKNMHKVEQQIASIKSEVQTLTQQLKSQKEQYEQAQVILNKEIASLRSENEEYENKLHYQLKWEKDYCDAKLQEENDKLNKNVTDMTKQIETEVQNNSKLQEENKRLMSNYNILKNENENLNTKNKDLENKNQFQAGLVQINFVRRNDLEKKNQELIHCVANMKVQLEEAVKKNENLQEENNNLKNTHPTLENNCKISTNQTPWYQKPFALACFCLFLYGLLRDYKLLIRVCS